MKDEGLVQPIGKGARGLREARFDVADLEGRDVLGTGAGHEMDARQRRLGEGDVEVHFEGVDSLAQDRLHALAEIGVVTVTRHEYQARQKPAVGITAHEEPHARPFLQMQDPQGGLVELVQRDLEQLVARIGLEDVL